MSSFHFGFDDGPYPGGDGITRVTDPFWLNMCRECGHKFWSCLCTADCAECGGKNLERMLGGIPYEQIVAERGRQRKPKSE